MDKRAQKRDARASSAHAEDMWGSAAVPATAADSIETVRSRMTTSLGKSGHVNEFSTVFVKETVEAVAERKKGCDNPIDMSRRVKGLFAAMPHP